MVQCVKPALVPISKPTIGRNNYQGFMPGKVEVLPKGWNGYNQRPIDSDIKVEHDVELKMRDGARIYMDVYRPVSEDVQVPAIISWSPYGKKYNALTMLAMTPWNVGMIPADISGLEKFEGIDPGLWVAKGYAVINIDARGVGNSDGYVCIMGKQDAEDGHDAIEAIAKLPWCNGAVGMAGNSALAICQWHIAATQPPSLKAIAPWEGSGDLYREQFCRGGTFDLNNFGLIQKFIIQGNEGVEDFQTMTERSKGLMDDWWAEKRADMAKVNIPAYITGSDFGSIHTMGAIRGWLQVNNPNKWIRWARFQEWHDLYADAAKSQPGLMQFFDRYLKGIENDWESTPRVRWSALQFGDHEAIEDIILPDFPVPDTDYRSLYLTENETLAEQPAKEATTISYDAVEGKTHFTYTFKEKTRLIGLPKAHLFMSCPDNNDFSVTILLEKLDVDGTKLRHCNVKKSRWPVKSLTELGDDFNSGLIMFNGSNGLLRASHRAIDRSKSWHPQFPHHPHDHRDYVEPGKIVELEVGIWAMGVDYQPGQSIRVSVSGSNPTWPELKATLERTAEAPVNKGKHVIHFGGDHPSRVILPFVNIW